MNRYKNTKNIELHLFTLILKDVKEERTVSSIYSYGILGKQRKEIVFGLTRKYSGENQGNFKKMKDLAQTT